jgi:uncharacterized protein with beta-barrel porin domain
MLLAGVGTGGWAGRGRLRARFLDGVALGALASVSAAAVLGVSLAPPTRAATVNPVQNTTYDIQSGSNPITFGGATSVNTAGNSQPAVIGNLATNWNVTNQGSLKGDTYGVILDTPSTITNAGSIYGASNAALYLVAGGNVTNTSTGNITTGSGLYGVKLGGPGGVSNAGTITGLDFGVSIVGAGSVVNTGSISGASVGVYLRSAAGTVTNAGNITTVGAGHAAQLSNGGTITNQAGGYLGGGAVGALIQGAAGSVSNQGSITGTDYGVGLQAGGNVTNLASGNISGYAFAGNATFNQGGAAGVYTKNLAATVTNAGSITGTGYGVFLAAGGNVTNSAGGSITGAGKFGFGPVGYNSQRNGAIGVLITGAAGAVTNTGSIYGVEYGVKLGAGGTLTNSAGGNISGDQGVRLSAGGTVTNTGTILGLGGGPSTAYGVAAYNAPAVVTNSGNISGYQVYAVSLQAGGTVTNTRTGYLGGGVYITNGNGNVTNDGRIAGYYTGVRFGGYSNVPMTATLTNTGTITAGVSYAGILGYGNATAVTVTNSGSVSGLVGAYLQGNSTVTNLAGGNITGTNDAVRFGSKYGEAITGSVTNAGTISGTVTGVSTFNDGNATLIVTNQAGGLIKGGSNGVRALGPATITNAGTIVGKNNDGIRLNGGGSVTNQAGGNISGGTFGIEITGAAGNVTNAGLVSGGTFGVGFAKGGSVANLGGGTIRATGPVGSGVFISGGDGVVSNGGAISGARYGVYDKGNLTLTNAAGGTIAFTGNSTFAHRYAAMQVNGAGVVTNAGDIAAGPGMFAYGVRMSSGTLTNSGNISATNVADAAVYIRGLGSVTNSGTITAGAGPGVELVSGNLTNLSGGVIVAGGYSVTLGSGTVFNAGGIGNATSGGVAIVGSGGVDNQTGGAISGGDGVVGFSVGGNLTVVNAVGASITGTGSGLLYGAGIYTRAVATVTNAGSITGSGNLSLGIDLRQGGTVTNTGVISGAAYGIRSADLLNSGVGGTVTNAGTISGSAASVVFFGNTTNVLTLETGSTLIGPAIGSPASAASNALVLRGQGVANNNFVNFQTLTVNAGGVWALNGVSTIGTTAINSGDLAVGDAGHPGANLTSAVTVNTGGTLSGHGTVTGSVVDNGGTIAPGGTIGVLTITGNLSLSGTSTTDIEIAPPNQSSLLVVGGTATLGGGLDFLADPGVYRKGEQFHFLTAGAISGSFAGFTVSNGLPGSLTQTGTTDTLTLLAGNFAATNGTPNQTAIGAAVNDIPLGAGDFDPVFNALVAIGPGAAQNHALDELGGEIYADTLTVGRQTTRGFLGTLDDHLEGADSGAAAGASGAATGDPAVWGQLLGRFDRINGDGNAHGFTANAGGLAFGVSGVWGPTTAGAALSWDETNLSLHGLPQSGRVDTTQIAAYGEERFGGMVYVNGAASVGFTNGHGERSIVFTGVDRHASGDFNGTTVGLAANLGARMPMGDGWIAEPSVGVVYSSVHQGDVHEAGAGSADLAVAGKTQGATASMVAVRLANAMPTPEGLLSADVKIAWAHDFNGLTPVVAESFPVTPGAGFRLAGANTAQDAGIFSGGLNLAASHQLSVFARYDASLASGDTEQMVDLGLKFRW